MSVIVIRAHSRFAVRRWARLRKAGRRGVDALLIELSIGGARLSRTAGADLAVSDKLQLRVPGAAPIAAHVRWTEDGTLGLRFDQPLTFAALEMLVHLCRLEVVPVPAYGT